MAYPSSLDDLSSSRASQGTDKLSSPNHLTHHIAEDSAIEALEAKIGVNGSAVATSIDYLLKHASSINPGHKHNFLSALDGSPAQAVYVDNTGNVGIGTTGPNTMLDVVTSSGIADIRAYSTDATLYSAVHSKGDNAGISMYGFGTSIAGTYFGVNRADTGALLESGGNMLLGVISDDDIVIGTYNLERVRIKNDGNVGIGTTGPTAYLHLKAGIASANGSPLKFDLGVLNTSPESGAIEYDGNNLYFVDNGNIRRQLAVVA